MRIIRTSRLLLVLFILVSCGAQFGPGYSMHDKHYFGESPFIAERASTYRLRWQYGTMGFYFHPDSKIVNGELLFSLQGTSSSGAYQGKYGEIPIANPKEIKLLRSGDIYWLEPDGKKIRLEIRQM